MSLIDISRPVRAALTVVTQPDPDDGGSQTSPVTSYTYDAAGNLTVVTDPLSRATTLAYDAANRRTSITQPDPDGGGSLTSPITTFTYDNLDRLTSLRDPVNNVTSWTSDAAGRVTTEVDPLSKTTSYTYDGAGQLTRIVDRNGQRRDFAYDNLGRRTQEYWCPAGSGSASGCGTSTPTRIFTYSYDAANQLTEVNETDSRYTFTYDNMGRVTGISSLGSNMPSVTLTNTYDTIGRRTNVSDNLSPAGSTTFTYDAANRMTNVKLTVGGTLGPQVNFTYDAASRLTGLTRQDGNAFYPPPNKVLTTFTYDSTDRMTSITHTYVPGQGSSSTIATYTYAYNAASELTNETNQDGSFTYTYDNTSQLTGVDASGGTCGATGCDESFSYDVNGNRTMTGYTTGTGNRLTSDGTYNYTFDDNGNALTKTRISDGQKWEYTWDYRNRLTQVVVKNSGGTVLQQTNFTYDAVNRRIIKTHDPDGPGSQQPATTKTLYDGADFAASPYADFDGNNSLTMRYLYGPAVDMILARRDASGIVAWHLADRAASVHDLVNTSGAVLDHIRYSAYGIVTAESQPTNGDRFKYTGREFDSELGVYYYRARYYDPATGRFISQDPLSFAAGDSDLYRYTYNSPVNATDPDGELIHILGGMIVGAVVGGVVAAVTGGSIVQGAALGAVAGGVAAATAGLAAPAVATAMGIGTAGGGVLGTATTAVAGGIVGGASAAAGNVAAQGVNNVVNAGANAYYGNTVTWSFSWSSLALSTALGVVVGAGTIRPAPPAGARPTINLGGQNDPGFPGATDVQPPGSPAIYPGTIVAAGDEIASTFGPNSCNVVCQNSPIAGNAAGIPGLGPPYSPGQMVQVAGGGGTITVIPASNASSIAPPLGSTVTTTTMTGTSGLMPPGSVATAVIITTPAVPASSAGAIAGAAAGGTGQMQ